jgi:hypothetical protein
MGVRHVMPDGRWMQAEPLLWMGLPSGGELTPRSWMSRYARGNPVMGSDRSGYEEVNCDTSNAGKCRTTEGRGEAGSALLHSMGVDTSGSVEEQKDDAEQVRLSAEYAAHAPANVGAVESQQAGLGNKATVAAAVIWALWERWVGGPGSKGGAAPVRLGQAGEDAVRGVFNIGSKVKIPINGRFRIPNGMTPTTLSEVKNVKALSFTRQLRDFADYAQQTGRRFDLYVRPSTTLSGPLRDAIGLGTINLKFIPL